MDIADVKNIAEKYKWLEWKIAPDGTYLTVVPELVPKNWDINQIKKVLIDNKIINSDMKRIENTIKTATGKMEAIGPALELFDEGKRKYLHLQVTPTQVSFSIDSSIQQTNYQITKDDIYFLLSEKSVSHGIDNETIEEILRAGAYGQEFIIASATMPILGEDAVITEVAQIDLDAKPFINEDGSVDYKRWENIRQVRIGDVICTRTPPTPGLPGISVFGQPLSPTPGEDYALPQGTNTDVIDNETKLVAAISGFLYREGRDISVGNVYIIKGDVDFKTGNIDYYGDVLVRQNVNAGFSVVAEGNISIEGSVESAHIESKKGNVFLKGSVFGLNNTNIIAGKNIRAANIQDAKIKAGETLTVSGQIRSCNIETKNIEMPREGQIIGSKVSFSGKLKFGCIGGKTESLNEFTYVENERNQLKEELLKLNEFLPKLIKTIEVLQGKLFDIGSAEMTPESENQKKLINSQLAACNTSREQLAEKRKKLLKLIEFMPDKDALISAYLLLPMLKLTIYNSIKEYRQELKNLKISWRGGGTKMESI
jgi:uncharacterized protein (DUF342 family)